MSDMSDEIRRERGGSTHPEGIAQQREKRLKEHRRRSNNDILATRRGTKSARSSSNSNRHFQPGWTSSTGTDTGTDAGRAERTSDSSNGRDAANGPQRGTFTVADGKVCTGAKVLAFPVLPDKRQEDSEVDSQD